MHEDTIKEVIRWMNAGSHPDRVMAVPLADNVKVGVAWTQPPNALCNVHGDRFFFICAGSGHVVAAVYDMHHDLHAFTDEDYRGQAFMRTALNDVILPFFAAEGRLEQTVSFYESNEAARKLVEGLYERHPMIETTKSEGRVWIKIRTTTRDGVVAHPKVELTERAAERLRLKLFHARNLVRSVREELAFYCEDSDSILADLDSIDEDGLNPVSEEVYGRAWAAKRRTI